MAALTFCAGLAHTRIRFDLVTMPPSWARLIIAAIVVEGGAIFLKVRGTVSGCVRSLRARLDHHDRLGLTAEVVDEGAPRRPRLSSWMRRVCAPQPATVTQIVAGDARDGRSAGRGRAQTPAIRRIASLSCSVGRPSQYRRAATRAQGTAENVASRVLPIS